MDLPKSIEAYYQETGRAGRDGLPSDAILFFGIEDAAKLGSMIENGESDEKRKQIERRKLDALVGFCASTRCRRQTLLGYFGETPPEPCGNCDACLNPAASFDGTVAAQKALSCVCRTGQKFGAAHLTDILLGGKTDRIRQFHHDALPTYGIGKEFSRDQWRDIFRQLVAQGILAMDMEGHGGLRFSSSETCRPVLRGEQKIYFRETPVAQTSRELKREIAQRRRASQDRDISSLGDGEEERLFQNLRALRMKLAKAQNVPPYVIFHDSALVEMSALKPSGLEGMRAVKGMGEKKLERYGEAFLKVIGGSRPEDAAESVAAPTGSETHSSVSSRTPLSARPATVLRPWSWPDASSRTSC